MYVNKKSPWFAEANHELFNEEIIISHYPYDIDHKIQEAAAVL